MVLVLLLSLMGLTIGLSQVSRSLSDLKQVSYVDFGTKAFFGAETGLQWGLKQLSLDNINCSPGTNLVADLGMTIPGMKEVNITVCPSADTPRATFMGLVSDGVVQIDLTKMAPSATGIDVLWKNPSGAEISPLEVIVVGSDGKIKRYVYNGTNTDSTGFLASQVGSSCTTGSCNLNAFNSGRCTASRVPVTSADKILRVKPLAGSSGSTDIGLCGRSNTGAANLGSVNYTVTATATTNNNTQKKLQTIKVPAALPGIFDFALFSKGSIVKN